MDLILNRGPQNGKNRNRPVVMDGIYMLTCIAELRIEIFGEGHDLLRWKLVSGNKLLCRKVYISSTYCYEGIQEEKRKGNDTWCVELRKFLPASKYL